MSKVKRFSLEERYGYQNRKVIYDKNADNDIELNNIYPIIDLFNQLDEQIADLEAKLEEIEESARAVIDANFKIAEERDKLKQQLAEKEEKIEYTYTINFVETSEPDIVAKELDRLNEQLAEKDKEIVRLNKFLQAMKIREHNQDKISFAVEQLEKVKEFFLKEHRDEEMDTDYIITKNAGEIADYLLDQIKQLKEKNNATRKN